MLVLLVGGVVGAISSGVQQNADDDRISRAQSVAESYARQIDSQRSASIVQSIRSGRAPASVSAPAPLLTEGEMGRDPWGHAYNYRVHTSNDDGRHYVLVWSNGPNGVSESKATHTSAKTEAVSGHNEFGFAGDDVGFVYVSQAHH